MKNMKIKIIVLVIGGVCMMLVGSIFQELRHSQVIFNMGWAYLVASLMQWIRLRKMRKDPLRYEAQMQERRISLQDERKIMLREKSGRWAYIIVLYTIMVLALGFSFTGVDEWIIWGLWGLLIYAYILGVVLFYWLSKKY